MYARYAKLNRVFSSRHRFFLYIVYIYFLSTLKSKHNINITSSTMSYSNVLFLVVLLRKGRFKDKRDQREHWMFNSSCQRNVAKFNGTCCYIKRICRSNHTMYLSYMRSDARGKWFYFYLLHVLHIVPVVRILIRHRHRIARKILFSFSWAFFGAARARRRGRLNLNVSLLQDVNNTYGSKKYRRVCAADVCYMLALPRPRPRWSLETNP